MRRLTTLSAGDCARVETVCGRFLRDKCGRRFAVDGQTILGRLKDTSCFRLLHIGIIGMNTHV